MNLYRQPFIRLSVDWSSYISNTKICQNSVNELRANLQFNSAGAQRQTAVLGTRCFSCNVSNINFRIYLHFPYTQNTQKRVKVEGYHRLRPVLSHHRFHKRLSRTSNQDNPSITSISQACLGRMPGIIHHFLSERKMTC